MIENSAFFLGDRMFTELLGPAMDKHLNHYVFHFNQNSFVGGQHAHDSFTMDFRNVQDPYITDGYADFRFMGYL